MWRAFSCCVVLACGLLDATGKPTSVAVTNTTGIANYDRKIVDRMWMWAFNPILVDGKPAKVCSQVTFLFEQTKPVVIQRHGP